MFKKALNAFKNVVKKVSYVYEKAKEYAVQGYTWVKNKIKDQVDRINEKKERKKTKATGHRDGKASANSGDAKKEMDRMNALWESTLKRDIHRADSLEAEREELNALKVEYKRKLQELENKEIKRRTEHLIATVEELLEKINVVFSGNELTDFEAYSRLVASMQFLQSVLDKLNKTKSYKDLSQLDIEFIESTKHFLSEKSMTDEELSAFDKEVIKRFGKNLTVIGAEHLVVLWAGEVTMLESHRGDISTKIARNRRHRIYLRNEKEDKTITAEQIEQENLLRIERNELDQKMDKLNARIDNVRIVAGATEGIIAVMEGKIKQKYMKDEAIQVAEIIATLDSNNFQDISPKLYDRISHFSDKYEFQSTERSENIFGNIGGDNSIEIETS